MKVKVGIDARCLLYPFYTGVEKYVYNLVWELVNLDSENIDYTLYVDEPVKKDIFEALNPGKHIRYVEILRKRGWLKLFLPVYTMLHKVNLIHFPASIAPPFLNCPKIITVHDCAKIAVPDCYQQHEIDHFYEQLPFTANKSDLILADSESTRIDLISHLNVPPDKVIAVHLGVEEKYGTVEKDEARTYLKEKYYIGGQFVLTAGIHHRRKNTLKLIESYALVKARSGTDWPLILVGGAGPLEQELKKKASELKIQDSLIFTGYVPEEDLVYFYTAAEIFVFPSLYEGFGLPVLEAMACGTPVIASDNSSLPEVVGDTGILVDPTDPNEICTSIITLMEDPTLRTMLSNKGQKRARQFTWEKTALETLEAYKRLL